MLEPHKRAGTKPVSEHGDEKVRAWNDRAALVRHAWVIGGALVVIGVMWNNLSRDVAQADQKGKENSAQIEVLKEKINKIDVQQQIIITNQDNDRRNQVEFRTQTQGTLESILKKLERAERRDTDRGTR